jgi:ABC-type sulfate transport system permease subunit
MAELMLALIVILGLILAWIILLIGVKSKGLGKVILDEPFTVFFVVVGTILAIVLVKEPLI